MIYIIGMACMTGTLSAQTVVDYSTFEQKVLDYSQTLKQSVAQRTAMQKAMKAAKTAFFPAVSAPIKAGIGNMVEIESVKSISASGSYGARFIQCRSRGITTYLCRWKHLSQLQGFPNTNPDGG